jgi:hypothetical protein
MMDLQVAMRRSQGPPRLGVLDEEYGRMVRDLTVEMGWFGG